MCRHSAKTDSQIRQLRKDGKWLGPSSYIIQESAVYTHDVALPSASAYCPRYHRCCCFLAAGELSSCFRCCPSRRSSDGFSDVTAASLSAGGGAVLAARFAARAAASAGLGGTLTVICTWHQNLVTPTPISTSQFCGGRQQPRSERAPEWCQLSKCYASSWHLAGICVILRGTGDWPDPPLSDATKSKLLPSKQWRN